MDLTVLGNTTSHQIDLTVLDNIPSSGIIQNASTINNYFGNQQRRNSPTPPPEEDGSEMCINSTYGLDYCEEYCYDCEQRGAIYAKKSEGTLVDIIHSVLSHLMLVSPAPKRLVRYPKEFESEIVEDDTIIDTDIITEVRNDKALPAVTTKPNDFNEWQQKQIEHEREMLELEKQAIALEREKLGYHAYQEKLEEKEIEEVSQDINSRFQMELRRRGA